MRNQDPLIVETLVEVLAQDGIQLHTKALPEEVVKNADGSLTLKLQDGRETHSGYVNLGDWSRTGNGCD